MVFLSKGRHPYKYNILLLYGHEVFMNKLKHLKMLSTSVSTN